MEEIGNFGERTWAGHLGNAFIVLSFVAALTSTVFYYLSSKDKSYYKAARFSFLTHSFSVFGIAATLFYMLFNHFFEYQYVFQHSNKSMDMKYILSCFWEGQEGSFLLWTFWNVILGIFLKKRLDETWEAPVMTIFSLVQVFLASMILGIYLGDYKIGSNPFLLLREHTDYNHLPFLNTPNYLAKIDGRGLNPLLMNYWMTIHPPTLFLGFSSTLIPFAFAIAALWKRKVNEWQSIALPYTFFGVLILGVGILMGGAWAYEALSFGGFWAWDPVENSSLVPWIILVAAAHTMLINKNKGGSVFTTHILAIAGFLLVLYSTFLTRSGILGNASVHAFTDLGMQGQLVIYVLTFIFISVVLLIDNELIKMSYIVGSFLLLFFAVMFNLKRYALFVWLPASTVLTIFAYVNYFPKEKQEEELYSREFWLFLGSLLLLLSGLIITYFTSIPVINKLFGLNNAPLKVADYNLWMVPFSILILLLMAGAQFLKYKKTEARQFYKKLLRSFLIALVLGLVSGIPLYFLRDFGMADSGVQKWNLISYTLLLIAGFFAVFSNCDYWLSILKGNVMKSGASIAHMGFALIMIGALISTSKKITLSKNTANKKVESLGKDFDGQKSILLTMGDTLAMGPYLVSYREKIREGINVFFNVDYFTVNKDNKPEFAFTLTPRVQDNPRMGKAPDPDTRHFLDRDIYTHVTYADLSAPLKKEEQKNKFAEPKNYIGHVGDTIFASNALVIIDSIRTNISREEYNKNDSLLIVTAVLRCVNSQNQSTYVYPEYIIKNSTIFPKEAIQEALGLKFAFWKINPDEGTIEITMSENVNNTKDFIVMEAHLFPYINVLWLGCIVMAFGTLIAIIERIRVLRLKSKTL
jgi:cytochrome c-type biogenesis protein CcmF